MVTERDGGEQWDGSLADTLYKEPRTEQRDDGIEQVKFLTAGLGTSARSKQLVEADELGRHTPHLCHLPVPRTAL